MLEFSIFTDNIGKYFGGLGVTLQLVAFALIFGLILAVPIGLARTSKNPAIWGPAWAYIYFFRGTPLLVQIYMIYFGTGQFEFIRESFLWPFFSEAYFCALFAFTLNTAGYTAEIVRGSVEATPHGEVEAAKACGMSKPLMYRRVILPSAFRRALPAYSNEVIFMLHGSSIASLITIADITGVAREVYSTHYSPFEAFIMAGLFYMALTFIIVGAFKRLERHWHAHLKPRSS